MYLKYFCKRTLLKNCSSVSIPSSTLSMLSCRLDYDITDNNEISDFKIINDNNFNRNITQYFTK